MRHALVSAILVTFAAGCSLTPSSGARAQEAANDFNLNTRFGRMNLAVERVAPSDRDAFAKRHGGWGGKVRIADMEMAGINPKSESEAQVTVKVAWYRPEEQELRVTTLKQTWKAPKGEWMLTGEERLDGDLGLFGEPVVVVAPPEPRKNPRFST